MLEKDMDWESELHRLLEPTGSETTSKGVPVMLIEGGSLAIYNAYDRRYDSHHCPQQLSHWDLNDFRCLDLTRSTYSWTEQVISRQYNC